MISRRFLTNKSVNIPITISPLTPYKSTIEIKGIVFDKLGNVKLIEEEWKKSELCQNLSVFPRDLRLLESSSQLNRPAVLIREKSIIVNLGHIRAVIQHNTLTVFCEENQGHEFHSALIHEFIGKVGSKDLPFELKSLEAILVNVLTRINQIELESVPVIQRFLLSLNEYVNQDKLKILLDHKRHLTSLARQIDALGSVLTHILEKDEDITGLYITDKMNKKNRPITDHMEAELLLEHFVDLIDGVSSKVNGVLSDIHSTEAIMHITLDKQRNNLILFDLKANLVTLSVTSGTFISSIFGMNLISSFESTSGLLSISLFYSGLFYLIAASSMIVTLGAYRFATHRLLTIKPGRISVMDEYEQIWKHPPTNAKSTTNTNSPPAPPTSESKESLQ